ncbi:type II toxin-antitoxin system HicA family toxin [Burkholderia gladioli]|nr:type II toxin-antitoxin system HicA family toxin [Burkholderia gladioli]MDC6130802.1 type II toxin-antitoxin system HicA family toxin [Burkholderia gladioli]
MSGVHPPLTCKDVKRVLKALGFVHRNTEGSHEQWVRDEPPPFRKVTVDCPKAPFSQFLLEIMASQAGLTKKEFYKEFRKL